MNECMCVRTYVCVYVCVCVHYILCISADFVIDHEVVEKARQ